MADDELKPPTDADRTLGGIVFYGAALMMMVGFVVWLGPGAGLVIDAIILFGMAGILMSKKK